MLARRGAAVEAVLLSSKVHVDGLAALRAPAAAPCRVDEAHRPDVVVDGIVGIGGRPGLRPTPRRRWRCFAGVPVVAVDVPSGVDVDTGRLDGPHVTRRPDGHLRHPQGRPPRRSRGPGVRGGAPRRHRARPARGAGRGAAAGRRGRAAAGARPVRPQVHPRCRRRTRRVGDLSRRRGALHVRRRVRAGRDGALPGLGRRRRARPAPGDRRRGRPGAGLGGRVRRRRRRRAGARGRPGRRRADRGRRRRADPRRARPAGRRAHPARGRAGADARCRA